MTPERITAPCRHIKMCFMQKCAAYPMDIDVIGVIVLTAMTHGQLVWDCGTVMRLKPRVEGRIYPGQSNAFD
jgi:hypothetical protein